MHPITTVWPGRRYPRGAECDGEGVNFEADPLIAADGCWYNPKLSDAPCD